MASVASWGLLYPSTITKRRSRGRISNPSRLLVQSRDRRLIFGSRVGNVQQQQHFGRLWSTITSSPPPLPPSSSSSSSSSRVLFSRPIIHCCSRRASSTDLSCSLAKPTNGSRGDELVSNGTILSGSDRLSSVKEESILAPTENRFRIEHPTPNQFVSMALQRRDELLLASVVLACLCLPNAAHSLAENSIGASSLGIKVAKFLRRSGLSDELVVVIVGMVPVLELRGAIPISYWLKIQPVKGYLLSVLGNMIPVPFIVLYLEKILKTIGEKGESGQNLVRWIVDLTRKKAGPIEEFEWLGLLLFVAVPLPGTGAWSGAIAASILGMPFWDAVTANLAGVLLAGLLVTLLVTVGTKEAVIVGIAMFVSSCCVWSVLRLFQKKRRTSSS